MSGDTSGYDGLNEARAALACALTIDAVRKAVDDERKRIATAASEGAQAQALTRMITGLNDAAFRRLIELLDHEQKTAGACCWIVMGSQGRAEQTLATDQDNGIILADDADRAGFRSTVLELAARVNHALDACGYPLCRGNVMAGNPECCLTASEWRSRFARWIERGDPQALLNAAIFFDFRHVHGTREPAQNLREWLAEAALDNSRFLLQLAQNALENRPPLGFLRDFELSARGQHPHTLDLKVNGVQLFVEAARIYALATGVTGTGTIERLDIGGALRRIPAAQIGEWTDSFRFIQTRRLALNVAQARRGEALHNHLDPDSLSRPERHALKNAFRQARRLQAQLARDFGAAAGGFGA